MFSHLGFWTTLSQVGWYSGMLQWKDMENLDFCRSSQICGKISTKKACVQNKSWNSEHNIIELNNYLLKGVVYRHKYRWDKILNTKFFLDQNIIIHKLNLATHWMPSRELSWDLIFAKLSRSLLFNIIWYIKWRP